MQTKYLRLLSPAGVDSIDPLDMPAGEVDLSYPIAPASNYHMKLTDPKVEPNKKGTGNNLVLKWKNVAEITSTKGDIIPVGGLVITQYMGLTETEKRTRKAIAQDVTRLIRGAQLPLDTKPSSIVADPSPLADKEMLVKVNVRQATAEYPESNEVRGVVLEG